MPDAASDGDEAVARSTGRGFGRVLVTVYGIFALAATARSLVQIATRFDEAPVAYLLYQNVLRHDPADPHWLGRDRFVLSAGHSSLTQYIQLYLSGYGLELSDLEALRTWGSLTPGHPEVEHTAGVEITTASIVSPSELIISRKSRNVLASLCLFAAPFRLLRSTSQSAATSTFL